MVDFYTRLLGFKVSDVNEKGMTSCACCRLFDWE